mmetsp:Transcript_17700/g.21337  ORF Transcript_17700/g.21337 Transcript_17700/m.21337 type:complete len:254 (+) Transcript_17700:107-868(+)
MTWATRTSRAPVAVIIVVVLASCACLLSASFSPRSALRRTITTRQSYTLCRTPMVRRQQQQQQQQPSSTSRSPFLSAPPRLTEILSVRAANNDFKGFGEEPKTDSKTSSKRKKYGNPDTMSAEEIKAAMEEMESRNQMTRTQVVESSTQRSAAAELVSTRILYRILAFAGVPTFSGILLLPLFYVLRVTKGIEIPMWGVYLSQVFFIGGGLLGISYGALSASWDPMRPGSALGVEEFRINLPVIWARIRNGGE